MVVLNIKNIKGLVLILLLTTGILASCSKDRLIDIEPYTYPTEYWKKDSLVYTLLLDTTVLNQQVTPYGISSPDTLSLFYETQEYTLTFLEEGKDKELETLLSSVLLKSENFAKALEEKAKKLSEDKEDGEDVSSIETKNILEQLISEENNHFVNLMKMEVECILFLIKDFKK